MKDLTVSKQHNSIQNFKKFEIVKTQHNKIKGGDDGQTDAEGDIFIEHDVHV